jgi:hypothetical protein
MKVKILRKYIFDFYSFFKNKKYLKFNNFHNIDLKFIKPLSSIEGFPMVPRAHPNFPKF